MKVLTKKLTVIVSMVSLLFLFLPKISLADPQCGGNGEGINNCNCYKISIKNTSSGNLTLGGMSNSSGGGTFFGGNSSTAGPGETIMFYAGTTGKGQDHWTATSIASLNVSGVTTNLTVGFGGQAKDTGEECTATFSILPQSYGSIGACTVNNGNGCNYCDESGGSALSYNTGGTTGSPGSAEVSGSICSLK